MADFSAEIGHVCIYVDSYTTWVNPHDKRVTLAAESG
jgi:hypothetical protein